MSVKLTKEQKRVKKIVEKFKKYVDTYPEEMYLNYSEEIIVDDILYGLGISLDFEEYSFAQGYIKFKKRLLEKLKKDPNLVDTNRKSV